MNFLKELFGLKKEEEMKIGLSQFSKVVATTPRKEEVSIRTKDVKLSDLMRRAG